MRASVAVTAFSMLLIGASTAGPAHAFDGLMGARALGFGDALRTTPSSAGAILLNPAALALYKAFNFEANYLYGRADGLHGMDVAFADSTSSLKLAGAVHYSYFRSSPFVTGTNRQQTNQGHDFGVTLAYPFSDAFAIGATGKYNKIVIDPVGNRPRFDRNSGNLDVSGVITIGSMRFSVIGQNVINADSPDIPVLLTFGAAYGGTTLPLIVAASATIDFTTWDRATARYALGGEYTIGQTVGVRAGYSVDTGGAVRHFAHVGASLLWSKGSVDLGVRQQGNLEKDTMIGVALRFFSQ